MTPNDIAQHNQTLAVLTAEDGYRRLSWEQHKTAFDQPVSLDLQPGQQVAAWDSATLGTVGELRNGHYDVTFPDLHGLPCRYRASQLRPVA